MGTAARIERLESARGASALDHAAGVATREPVDAFVQKSVAWTNGHFYLTLGGKLERYPIPELDLPAGNGARFVEIGCNWGRWALAATNRGYRAVGIDLSTEAIAAATRVAAALNSPATYVTGSALGLPLRDGSVDVAFSFGTLQYFPTDLLNAALGEISRVLRPGGICKVQMRNRFGPMSIVNQLRRWFRAPVAVEVHYRSVGELRRMFREQIGEARTEPASFFAAVAQPIDLEFVPRRYHPIVRTSLAMLSASKVFSPLGWFADGVYVIARKPGAPDSAVAAARPDAR